MSLTLGEMWLYTVEIYQHSLLCVAYWVLLGLLICKSHHIPAHAFVQASVHLCQVRCWTTVEERG